MILRHAARTEMFSSTELSCYYCKVERRYLSPYSDQTAGWKTDTPCLISCREKGFFFSEAFRRTAGPSHSPHYWEREALSLGIKRPVREADNLPSSRAVIKNFTLQYALMTCTRAVLSLLTLGVEIFF